MADATANIAPIRDLIARFGPALEAKLIASEEKHGWKNGWRRNHWRDKCLDEMHRHIGKGDPLDVAAYCAFMWHHGWSTAPAYAADTFDCSTAEELAQVLRERTGAQWRVDETETHHFDAICPTAAGHVTIRRLWGSQPGLNSGDAWALLTTAGAARNEWRGSFPTLAAAISKAQRLFTWHRPLHYLAEDGTPWMHVHTAMFRRPYWSEVVYFTEGETWGHARPRLGVIGWKLAQWIADRWTQQSKVRQTVVGWLLRFSGGADCPCVYDGPCEQQILEGQPCWHDTAAPKEAAHAQV